MGTMSILRVFLLSLWQFSPRSGLPRIHGGQVSAPGPFFFVGTAKRVRRTSIAWKSSNKCG